MAALAKIRLMHLLGLFKTKPLSLCARYWNKEKRSDITSEQSEFKLPHSLGRSSFSAHEHRNRDKKTMVVSFTFIGLTFK
ncbi:hypothetical protein ALTER154_80443 [Alteromonas sp. 154]|nr:hypothetical protein ALTER154_80443 [Alteromonas sp. 154]